MRTRPRVSYARVCVALMLAILWTSGVPAKRGTDADAAAPQIRTGRVPTTVRQNTQVALDAIERDPDAGVTSNGALLSLQRDQPTVQETSAFGSLGTRITTANLSTAWSLAKSAASTGPAGPSPVTTATPLSGPLFPAPKIPIPGSLSARATGDFNGDGHQDIAVVVGGYDLYVLLGSGTGSFDPLPAVALPVGAGVILLGDFDEDGQLDLLVGGFDAVLLSGRGDGSFAVGPILSNWNLAARSVVGDFNGDGHLDVAKASYGVQIMFGRGNGTFVTGPFNGLLNYVSQLAATDLDGDGHLDLVAETGLSIVRFFGRGNGTFQYDEWAYTLGGTQGDMRLGDWNRDGIPDVAITGYAPGDYSTPRLLVLVNDGHGELQAQSICPSRDGRLLGGDWDGDGLPDLAFHPSGEANLWVLTWQPGEGFTTRDSGQEIDGVEGADFNEDGRPDLLDLSSFGNLGIIFSRRPDGWIVRRRPIVNLVADGAVVGDFDGDGRMDIVALSRSASYRFQRARGDGSYESGPDVRFGLFQSYPLVGDVNEDGHLDLVIGQVDYVGPMTLLGQGDGSFRVAWQRGPLGAVLAGAALADVDHDGHLDLVTMEQGVGTTPISIYPGRGDGTFGPARQMLASGRLFRASMVDVDGDGNVDLVTLDFSAHAIGVLRGRGDGTFADTSRIPLERAPNRLATGDFNADGKVDIAVTALDGTSQVKGRLLVFLGRGDGTFDPAGDLPVDGFPTEITVADLDSDGRDDVAVATNAGTFSIFRSRPDGSPSTAEQYRGGVESFGTFIAVDENGDGRIDLLTVYNELYVYPNVGRLPNRRPVADAGTDQILECSGDLKAAAVLNGSVSSDPDSTPGTNDDIASYAWSEGGSPLATGETTSVPLHLGAHDVTLTVTDKAGATGTDDTLTTVQDTKPPVGAIVVPTAKGCFGPAALPLAVQDDFTDVCDPTVLRTYDPAPGPSYSQHGDYHVTLTAKDTTGNASTATVDFTIDTKPPTVQLLAPADRAVILPNSAPLTILFHDSDDDGAAGGVVHEVIKLQGCTIFDGLTYGNKDGLLSDETLTLGAGDLCRAAQACGFTTLTQPVLSVEATDCGGNVGVASHQLAGGIALRPGICGN